MNRAPELRILLEPNELVIDNFAGGGGTSEGIERVIAEIGRHVDIAINHDAEALALHKANHPHAHHFVEDIFKVDLVKACAGSPVGLSWYSPDCTFYSKARGGKPFRDRKVARRRRGLPGVILKHAAQLKAAGTPIRIIAMENVEEFAQWGPLGTDGKPCPLRKGFNFRRWWRRLENLGYRMDAWPLKACDYGAPTTRTRLFVVARYDEHDIVKPEPTHGPHTAQPYRTAAECIDWDIPCPSIFSRKKPLADNTLRRIAEGIRRFVINNPRPFIVPIAHAGDHRVNSVDEPLRTVTADRRGDFALVEPFIAGVGGRRGQSPSISVTKPAPTCTAKADAAIVTPVIARLGQQSGNGSYVNSPEDPLTTVTTKGEHLLIAPLLVPRYGEDPHRNGGAGQAPRCRSIEQPLSTIVTTQNGDTLAMAMLLKQNGVGKKMVVGQQLEEPVHTITTTDQKAVVTAFALKYKGTSKHGQALDEPLHTVQAGGLHYAEVRAFLIKYYRDGGQWADLKAPMPTVRTHDAIGLVTIHGEAYAIVDIGLRMLTPRELYRAQGFPEDYAIEISHEGKPLTKTAQVRMCGNSVCPPVAEALVRAQLTQAPAAVEMEAA